MKTETTTTTYRGHEIAITSHEANAQPEPWFTQENDVTSPGKIDFASDNAEDTDRIQGQVLYATAEAARKDAEAEMEDTLGTADPSEIEEAAVDLACAADHDKESHDRYAKTLLDQIASHQKSGANAQDAITAIRRGLEKAARK